MKKVGDFVLIDGKLWRIVKLGETYGYFAVPAFPEPTFFTEDRSVLVEEPVHRLWIGNLNIVV